MFRTQLRGRAARFVSGALTAAILATGLTSCSKASEDDPSASASAVPQLAVDPNSALGLPSLIGLEPIIDEDTIVLASDNSPVDGYEILNAVECDPYLVERVPCDFRITFAQVPAGVKAGSILVSDVTETTPAGLLVKVTGVDGDIVLATEATLGDALVQGEFLVEQQFTPADVVSVTLAEGVSPLDGTALASASVAGLGNGVPQPAPALANSVLTNPNLAAVLPQGVGGGLAFGYAINHVKLADGLYADGSVSFDVGCGAYGGLTWETAWGIPVYPNGAHFEAKCGVTQDGSITVTAEAKESIDYEKKIASIDLSPITFFVGPVPIVLLPAVEVWVNASGEVTANMSFGAAEHFGVVAGIRYHDGFSLIKDFSTDFSSSVSLGSGRLTAHAGVEMREELMLYGLVGPQLIEELYVNLNGKPPGERPIWCIDGGLKASVALNVDLGIQELRWGPGELFDFNEELACAGNSTPTITSTTAGASITVYPASTTVPPSIGGSAQDLEEGALPIAWSSNVDGSLGTTQPGKALSLKNLSLGDHVITGTATDSDGASASLTMFVTALVAEASIDILVKDGSGTFVSGSQISGVTGTTATVQVVGKSPIGIQVGSCLPTTWSGGLTVTQLGGCDYQVNLNNAGTYTLTATAKDPDGNTATDSVTVTITAPAPGSPPTFSEIQAKNTSLGNAAMCDGCALSWGETASLNIWYANYAQANKAVRYEWDMTTKPGGGTTGAWTTLAGTDGTPNSSSWRSFTAPQQYTKQYTYTFRVRVYDKTTNALLFTDTHVLTYSGPPA